MAGRQSRPHPLLDHLVGAGDERRRHFKAERLSGPEVDDKLEPGGAIDRHLGWLSPLEHSAGKDADPSIASVTLLP